MGLADLTGASHEVCHDVCIVGAGPVGIALALEMSRLKRRVLVLESGAAEADHVAQELSEAHVIDPARHDPMRIAVARRLGGTSNLWGGRCLPYDPIDFERRAIVGDAVWPVGFDDITPYYAKAIDYAFAGAPVFETDELSRSDEAFATGHLERWSRNRKAQDAHRAALTTDENIDVRLHATVASLRWSEGRVTHVIAVSPDGQRSAVPVHALVLATGGLESTRLLLAEQRAEPARFGGTQGALGRTYMGHVIGEIADITFADKRIDEAFNFAVDAHGSYARRRMTPSPALLRDNDLLNCAFWPVVPPVADPAHRDGFLSAIALALSVETIGSRVLPEAIRRRHIPAGMSRAPHLRNVLRGLPAAATEIPALLWRRYGASVPAPAFYKRNAARRYGLSYHSEQAPRRGSRVTLGDECDAVGMPRLAIDLRFSDDDARSVVTLHDHLSRWLTTTGLGRLDYRVPHDWRAEAVLDQASHGTHQIGTARMSPTAESGVVDADLRCWGSDNLFVASSAVLPTSGQANPTLTVMALAMRLAARLSRDDVAMPAREPALV